MDLFANKIKLKPEVKEKWVAALRSGEYKQVQGTLCRLPSGRKKQTEFCCLGVLCEVALKDGVSIKTAEEEVDANDFIEVDHKVKTYGNQQAVPPKEVMAWAFNFPYGTKMKAVRDNNWDSVGHKNEWGAFDSLYELNDAQGYTFKQLAKVIEDNL